MMQNAKKDTVLFSVGPHQVITQYVLARQKKIDKKIIAVIRTSVATDGIVIDKGLRDCEEYVNKILKLGKIVYINSIYRLWGRNKLEKLINLPFLKKRIRGLLSETKINADHIENIILTARYDIGEILLLSIFKNLKNIHFVSDGNPAIYTKTRRFRIPVYLTLLGYNNPYRQNPKVYFYKENLPEKFQNIIPSIIDNSIYQSVKMLFLKDKALNNWLSSIFVTLNKVKRSIIFLQPLETHPSLEINIDLYKKIIELELTKVKNTIIIKHHPRENNNTLGKFREILKLKFGQKVEFFDNSFFSRLPMEIYFKTLNIKRVITLFSTSSLFIKNTEVVFYSSNALPHKLIETTEYIAAKLKQRVNYV